MPEKKFLNKKIKFLPVLNERFTHTKTLNIKKVCKDKKGGPGEPEKPRAKRTCDLQKFFFVKNLVNEIYIMLNRE